MGSRRAPRIVTGPHSRAKSLRSSEPRPLLIQPDSQLDAQIGYTFQKGSRFDGLGITLQVSNVLDSPYRTYFDVNGTPVLETVEKYGRSWLLGAATTSRRVRWLCLMWRPTRRKLLLVPGWRVACFVAGLCRNLEAASRRAGDRPGFGNPGSVYRGGHDARAEGRPNDAGRHPFGHT